MAKRDVRKTGAFKVRVVWPYDPAAPLQYANNMAVSHTGQEYVLEFGTSFLAGLAGRSPEELTEFVKTTREINVVARIVLSSHGMQELDRLIRTRMKLDSLPQLDTPPEVDVTDEARS